jgi:hypothetical protein
MPESSERHPAAASHAGDRPESRTAIVDELERRIADLEEMGEERFGGFTRLDWFFCVAGALLVPYAFYLWYWP